MPCEAPTTAYRPANGGPLLFTKLPTAPDQTQLQLPCGKCILCRQEHARQWAVRITHEAQLWPLSSFVTLTYSDEHLPKNQQLHYPDLQNFWKRLRKKCGQLRYYSVGEYGDKTNRPHYHACIFGHAFEHERIILQREPFLLWTNKLLQDTWGLGHVSVGALNYATALYTASYVTKKLGYKHRYTMLDRESGELLDMVQPKAYISNGGGRKGTTPTAPIGKLWLEKYGTNVYDHDAVIINGTPQKPPRYYDKWLKKNDELKHTRIKEERNKNAEILTPEELRARATNARARKKLKTAKI
ncbi:replication initiator protein [Blackfly microvirus SF02]|uniref:Replication initiator protein n=1 Tax=Blackfly microvirus SF02 TaxID=2576452 RepID=A0A4P8PJL9_9VIRU|nr:replication initiator protein [Blackfly microvirus SF02]